MTFEYQGYSVEVYAEGDMHHPERTEWLARVRDRITTIYQTAPCTTREEVHADAVAWIDAR